MEALEFSIPYNNDPETLTEAFQLKALNQNSIVEVYLSGPQTYAGSGRIVPEMDMAAFTGTVDRIHRAGLRVNLVLNSTCEGAEWYSQKTLAATLAYLRLAHEEHGVEAITTANPLYISAIRKRLPGVEICASVLGNIDCVQRAVIYREAGADTITPDVNINRDLELLREIKEATGARLKLLVNEGCLYKCPFRQFHFNAKSHLSKEVNKPDIDVSFGDFFGAGAEVIRKDLAQLLKSCWIRPEDIRKYSDITRYFKLVCRSKPKSFVIRAIKAYMEEAWAGDLLDLVSGCSNRISANEGIYLDNRVLEDCHFFDTVTRCDHTCSRCDYCRMLAAQVIQTGVFTPEKGEDVFATEAYLALPKVS